MPFAHLRTQLELLLAHAFNSIVVAAHLGTARGEHNRLRFDDGSRFTQRGLALAPVITEPDALRGLQFAGEAGIIARPLGLPLHQSYAVAWLRSGGKKALDT